MWCTRWFLPLLLLPLPTAPPYFLVLFLLSLALHAKPCFYCVILLAALFLSSCYWQPFPLDTPLSVPWAANITTFSDALNATIPPDSDLHQVKPSVIRVVDRCWCDFASGVFHPFDVRKWEETSVQRLRAEMEKQMKVEAVVQLDEEQREQGDPIKGEEEDEAVSPLDTVDETVLPDSEDPPQVRSSFSVLQSLFRKREHGPKGHPPSATPTAEPSIHHSKTSDATPEPTPVYIPPPAPEELLAPGEVDLRPYGFDLILDFRWSRQS
ncbi:hypothetical protein BV22DRAFT_1078788 [Leucogyrophana mollusca]|uniref:Uncharacterized protein n=1 Tax=Leucogyrophana mollusca TaxID=85980 RepID=A0ACB8BX93_9AGAM|nr:hypothetical protein BV22DRAFT_1078788 [Leucogyrophana mollusca]